MKTALISVLSGMLLAGTISYPVDAHQAQAKRHVISRDFLAVVAPEGTSPTVFGRRSVFLDGPTHDATSTATGGPSGGIN